MKEQQKEELEIFRKFKLKCPYEIESFEPGADPPDIRCVLADGTEVGFELVECVDPNVARAGSYYWPVKKACDEELQRHPQRTVIERNLDHRTVLVRFKDSASLNTRRRSIPHILTRLSQLPKGYTGAVDVADFRGLRGVVDELEVDNDPLPGVWFEARVSTNFEDTTLACLKEKFKKPYTVGARLDLLAYYRGYAALLARANPPRRAMDYIEQNLRDSAFRTGRVWLYSVDNDEIISVCPP